nr:MAG TPA: hypothetical protein [Caudoviricetes sp.]
MSNPIASALGTQRQFTKQPEAPYQKRLITPSFGSGISASIDNNALALARSLGLLGSGLIGESIAADKRAEMIGKAEADRIFSVTSEKDREKLSTLDILGQSGKFDIADNPYAVARIDELRGQHLNTLFKQEYENEVVPNQELPDNSQQNILNFETFMDKKLQDSGVKAYNRTAFEKGFYGSRPLDVLQQDASYRKRRQADLEADRDAAIAAKGDDLILRSLSGMTPEDFANGAQEWQTDPMLTGMSRADRIKLVDEFARRTAPHGSVENLKAWGDTIVYHKDDGTPVRVKEVIPLGIYLGMAEKASVHLNSQKTRDFLQSLEGVPSASIWDKYEEVKKKDPLFFEAIAPTYDGVKKRAIQAEEKAAKAAAAAQESAFRQQLVTSTLDDRWLSHSQGKDVDSYGSPVYEDTITVNGKKVKITDEEKIAWANTKMVQFFNSLPLDEAGKATMNLLKFPQMDCLVKAMKGNTGNVLSSLSTQSLVHDETGALQLPAALNKFVAMYKTDKETFRYLFGKQGDEISVLSDLIDANGLEEGVSKFAMARENMSNPDFKKAVEKSADLQVGFDSNLSIPTLAGNGATEDIQFFANSGVQLMLSQSFKTNMYCGQTEEDAINNARKRTSDYFVSYKGCAFPKAFLYKIPSENQQKTVAMFLEDKMKQENGTRLMYSNGTLQIWRNGVATASKWNNTTIATDVAKWLQELPQEKRVLLEDVYYNPSFDTSDYYASNPDASKIEAAEKETGVDMSSPVGALIGAIGGLFK